MVGKVGKAAGDHGLVGEGYEHGVLREAADEFGQPVQQLVVLLHGLGKAEAGVEDDAVGAEGGEQVEPLVVVAGKVVDDVVVACVFRQQHGGGSAAHVHEDVRHAERDDGGEHLGVELAAGDVVDDVGTSLDGAGGGEALAGVDGDERVRQLGAEQGHEGRKLGGHVGRGEYGGTATGGHDPEVEDVGPLLQQLAGMGQERVGTVVAASVVEGVGGGVENAHHGGAPEGDCAPAAAEAEGRKLSRIVHEWKKMCIFVFLK